MYKIRFVKSKKLNESTFTAEKWSHGGKFDYAAKIIDKLLQGETLKTGKDGNGLITLSIDDFDEAKLTALKAQLETNPKATSFTDFEDCLKNKSLFGRKSAWTSLYKGDFIKANKGTEYEKSWENEEQYAYYINILKENGIIPEEEEAYPAELIGQLNSKRPLTVMNNGDIISYPSKTDSTNIFYAGPTVADVIVKTDRTENTGEEPYYISLKFGPTVAIANLGIGRVFPISSYIDGLPFADYDPRTGRPGADQLLGLFGIDEGLYRYVFNNYAKVNGLIEEEEFTPAQCELDALEDLPQGPMLSMSVMDMVDMDKIKVFIKSCIGYGYVIVHGMKRTTFVYDLREEKDVESFLQGTENPMSDPYVPNDIVVNYPLNGNKKQLDVVITYPNIIFTFSFRNKTSGRAYPTELVSSYKVLHRK